MNEKMTNIILKLKTTNKLHEQRTNLHVTRQLTVIICTADCYCAF